MSILSECPACHRKQSVRNKICRCGEDLDRAKRSKRVKYWISYRIPGSRKKYRQVVGLSIKKAKDADSKRKVQKRENRIFDMIPKSNISFSALAQWYLKLKKVKKLAMYEITKVHLDKFNSVFGETMVNRIRLTDLENYQADLVDKRHSFSYIDQIIGSARTVVKKAADDDRISRDCLQPFRKLRKLLKKNANARDVIFTHEQYEKVLSKLPLHLKPIFVTGYWTGMRLDEILELTWNKVDLKNRLIHLEAEDTKDDDPRRIPILDPLHDILSKIPQAIHDDHVFLFKGIPLKDIRTGFYGAMKATGVPFGRKTHGGLTFHDLRHTFNTNMRRAGVPESVIMQITGHATREMFDRYNLVDESDADEAAQTMLKYMENRGY